ncbi:restriction endonuclease subunit S [Paenibacillus thiaminolyticus]|uniref:Restriction endonuclease subunit S n=1 Tax=Paenibacillus thiaminolyticus TaxID=49283 RepID=A0ABT4FX42_PANTH|nr:restriction endonuclease subunit S [Paenibacillus thiaminolyticus]MCY9538722.1 restriction endonuclease subunit S [Paenibacillus thiaminolyticus]MCY9600397.1 restriction endonuclease subunit S [Paenibacillus thiaminolyticus]MCY9607273.1 restriction endonuclease subunit S [Paenibacillus thiaminolyticus]MCY9614464.1 restriction endonuclease subunit S [Paenibacillus thiaminolyticus]MCY9621506.1 restriction endonuclease subunit S [Paenibacillus thiaminolyticus]
MSFYLTKYKVGEVASVQTGPFGSQLHKEDYVERGTPIITVEHLGENRIIHDNTPFVSEDDVKRLSKYSLEKGDIVFSRVGSVDRRAYVSNKEEGWLFSGRCLRVRVTNKSLVDPIFLSYYFGLENFKEYVRNIAVGATMPSLNTKIMTGLEIEVPELGYQHQIAKTLKSLDDKIELNNAINKNLEEMAQALFKRWFVDFEFPNENGEPYKSSGGDMEWCEELEKEIPKGWTSDKIGNCTKLVSRGIAPKYVDNSEKRVINQKCIRNGMLNVALSRTHSSKVNEEKQLQFGDVLINSTGTGTLGRVAQVYEHLDNFTVDSHVTIVRSNVNNGLGYMGCLLKSMQPIFEHAATGSTGQTELGREVIKQMPILLPEQKMIDKFSGIYHSICTKMILIQKNNVVLSNTRDTLLPKLMSGEIRVPLDQA